MINEKVEDLKSIQTAMFIMAKSRMTEDTGKVATTKLPLVKSIRASGIRGLDMGMVHGVFVIPSFNLLEHGQTIDLRVTVN